MLCLVALCALLFPAQAQRQSPQAVAVQFSLPSSTSMPFPTSTLSTGDTQSFLVSNWGLSKGRIQDGPDNLAFVTDPFQNVSSTLSTESSGPVLEVTYPAGSYSHATGGSQLYSLWDSSAPFQSVLLTYEMALDNGFDWVKGGKLPGLRGGPAVNGCDGGSQPNGTDCFSARVMWRTAGIGEVYAYILRPNNLCGNVNVSCNDDFGVSVQRGSFTFNTGHWNRITMLVQLNTQGRANGNLLLYFNDVLALQQADLQFRRTTAVDIGGFWLSTFFGGSDNSWATPETTHSYFRNIQMWGSNAASTLDGPAVSKALPRIPAQSWLLAFATVMVAMISA